MRLSVLVLGALLGLAAQAMAAPAPKITNAADGIFSGFSTHPLVGLGEWHGLAQEMDFYSALIRDPRFAREVGNVVLETGGAAQQDTVDRYVNGENVPYAELRKVWTDVVGWVPTVPYTGSVNVYATIRAVNLTLPPDQRIKVWLGEPSIDWSLIKTKADWTPLVKQRETHAADLINQEILDKGKKALVIYGSGHLGVYPGYDNLRAQVEAHQPGAWFIVMPYVGYAQKACATRFEKNLRHWPVPALAAPVKGTSLGEKILRPDCLPFDPPPNVSKEQREIANRNNYGLTADALLYLGTRDHLNKASPMPDMYLDLDFRAELDRRNRIITGQPIESYTAEKSPAVSRPWTP
jgi:hypothetical protein